jgi:hypothetical protein
VFPAFVVGRGQDRCRGAAVVRDGGDQGDQFAFPVAVPVGDLVLDDPDEAGPVRVQVLTAPGGLDQDLALPGLASTRVFPPCQQPPCQRPGEFPAVETGRLPVSLPVRSPGAVGCGGSDLRRRGCERNAAIAGLSAGKPGHL